MNIKLYKNILNPLPNHREKVLGIEEKLKSLGFVYKCGNSYCEINLQNNIELIKMFSFLSTLGIHSGEVCWT